jgi:hypothetical protein
MSIIINRFGFNHTNSSLLFNLKTIVIMIFMIAALRINAKIISPVIDLFSLKFSIFKIHYQITDK